MPVFVDIEQPLVVKSVSKASSLLRGALHLAHLKDDSHLLVVDRVEVGLQQLQYGALGLFVANDRLSIYAGLFKLAGKEFPILCNERADPLELPGVLPEGERIRLDGQLVVALSHKTEGLLPLAQIDNAVFPNVNSIK